MSEGPTTAEVLEIEPLLNSLEMLGLDLSDLAFVSDWVRQVGISRFAKIAVAMVEANGEYRPLVVDVDCLAAMDLEIAGGSTEYQAAAKVAKSAFAGTVRLSTALPATEKTLAERLVKQFRRAEGEASGETAKSELAPQTADALRRAERRASAVIAVAPWMETMKNAASAVEAMKPHLPEVSRSLLAGAKALDETASILLSELKGATGAAQGD